MKHYGLAIGFLVISFLVIGMAIMYLSKDIKLKNNRDLGNSYLIPNISLLSLGLIWFAIGLYLTMIIKIQLI